jgi:hypothetical protein
MQRLFGQSISAGKNTRYVFATGYDKASSVKEGFVRQRSDKSAENASARICGNEY